MGEPTVPLFYEKVNERLLCKIMKESLSLFGRKAQNELFFFSPWLVCMKPVCGMG